MLGVVRFIAFDVSRYVRLTTEYYVAPFLTVLILWNFGVYVCTMNGSNILSDIKTLINDKFGCSSIL